MLNNWILEIQHLERRKLNKFPSRCNDLNQRSSKDVNPTMKEVQVMSELNQGTISREHENFTSNGILSRTERLYVVSVCMHLYMLAYLWVCLCLHFPTAYIVFIVLWNKYAVYRERKIDFQEFNLELEFVFIITFQALKFIAITEGYTIDYFCKLVENTFWQCWIRNMSCVSWLNFWSQICS